MMTEFSKIKKITILILFLFIGPNNLNAAIFPDFVIPDEEILEILETGPSWIPRPYKTPIEQGTLVNKENLDKLEPGLNKAQVKFLLGTPTIIDVFHEERWDYIYYNRDQGNFSDPKRITIIFKNEKVGEIYDQHKIIKKLGDEINNAYQDAPINNRVIDEESYQEIIIAKREDYLTATKQNRLPVCINDEYESYLSQKTLFNADEDTLEVRSDTQNQDEEGIFYASGNVEIERADDLVKSDEAQFNADTGVLNAEGNVRYLTEDLTLYATKGGYNLSLIHI